MLSILPTSEVWGQQTSRCDDALEVAQAQYVDGRFDEVIELLSDCLLHAGYSRSTTVQMHRLIALSHLQRDELDQARNIIVKLLGLVYDYEPHPVQDPPVYTALVNAIKQQLAVPPVMAPDSIVFQALPVPVLPTPPRPDARFSISLLGRVSSYGGERGFSAEDLVSEFSQNSGPSAEARVEYGFNRFLGAGLFFIVSRHPQLLRQIPNTPSVQVIYPETSSPVLFVTGLMGRMQFPGNPIVTPYLYLGAGASFIGLNDGIRTGFATVAGGGMEFNLARRISLFAEGGGLFVVPGIAVDLTDYDKFFDPFTMGGLGIRYKIPPSND